MFRGLLLGLFGGFCLLILLAAFGWMSINWYGMQGMLAQKTSEFIIEPGDSLGVVVMRLASQKLIEHPVLFNIMARVNGVATELHAGDYLISKGISNRELLDVFTEGQVRYYSATIVEGQTLKEALDVLNSNQKLTEPLLLKDLAGEMLELVDGGEGQSNLEGLFYPDTYNFELGTAVLSVLRMANKRLVSVLAEEWKHRDVGLPYRSPYEALIMASIIEKETGVSYERPDIAGVFVRRLNKKMRLQTDPTVIYGLRESFEGNLSKKMLKKETPYNTYMVKGLPPTPIALVGKSAIEAALHPAEGLFLYFVARGDGTHAFSSTLALHNLLVRKYQVKERRKEYRSTVE